MERDGWAECAKTFIARPEMSPSEGQMWVRKAERVWTWSCQRKTSKKIRRCSEEGRTEGWCDRGACWVWTAMKGCTEVNVLWQWVKFGTKDMEHKAVYGSPDHMTQLQPSPLPLPLSLHEEWLLATALCHDICLPPPRSRKRPGTAFLCRWRHVDPARWPGTDTRLPVAFITKQDCIGGVQRHWNNAHPSTGANSVLPRMKTPRSPSFVKRPTTSTFQHQHGSINIDGGRITVYTLGSRGAQSSRLLMRLIGKCCLILVWQNVNWGWSCLFNFY